MVARRLVAMRVEAAWKCRWAAVGMTATAREKSTARPVEAEAIARRAQALAARLHAWDAACFWWQLLTGLAPLEAFEPRHGAGFRKLESM